MIYRNLNIQNANIVSTKVYIKVVCSTEHSPSFISEGNVLGISDYCLWLREVERDDL